MKNKNILISFVIVITFVAITFFLINQGHFNLQFVKIAGQNIKVELAITPTEHAEGLSGQSGLKEDAGMLFVFSASGGESAPRFWMKDMNFPIDIIWISEDLKVIYIKKDARPELYPETYGPDISVNNVKYVLEVASGFSEKNDLQVGDEVLFTY